MNTEDLHRNMIAFGEWLLNSTFEKGGDGNKVFWWDNKYDSSYSTEELFQIYLKSLNNE